MIGEMVAEFEFGGDGPMLVWRWETEDGPAYEIRCAGDLGEPVMLVSVASIKALVTAEVGEFLYTVEERHAGDDG